MNIFELLELEASATSDDIRARAQDKRRYFANLLQSAPTQMLRDIYARRLADIDRFMDERGFSKPAGPTPAAANAAPAHAPAHTPGSGGLGGATGYFLQPDSGGAPIALHAGLNIVGRQPRNMGNPIVLDDTYVSANHAVVEVIAGPPSTVHLYDIGEVSSKPSTNGVFVNHNSARINNRVALFDGVHVRFGQTGFTLRAVVAAAPPSPANSGDDESLKTVIIKAPFR